MSCAVDSLDGAPGCSRAQVVPWYLQQEARPGGCPLEAAVHDLYQFGVPTEMNATIAELEARGIASYRHYYGFDSFRGLPSEQGAKLPPAGQWKAGQFSDVLAMSPDFKEIFDRATWQRRYHPVAGSVSKPLSVDGVVRIRERELLAHLKRIKLVAGFYNESLTSSLAAHAHPAQYVDVNCDLYVSTLDALRWLFKHGLARAGSLIGYDDWLETPYLTGGESKAHLEISREFRVRFEYLPRRGCLRPLYFRVRSVGGAPDHGITPALEKASLAHQCHHRRKMCERESGSLFEGRRT